MSEQHSLMPLNGVVELGMAGVDSGMLMVVDPCYVMQRGAKYDALIGGVRGSCGFFTADGGVAFSTQIGDGSYPVRGVYKNGQLMRVEILIHQDPEDSAQAIHY